jgi:hypothetical protein
MAALMREAKEGADVERMGRRDMANSDVADGHGCISNTRKNPGENPPDRSTKLRAAGAAGNTFPRTGPG